MLIRCSPSIGGGWGRPTDKLGGAPIGDTEHFWIKKRGKPEWYPLCKTAPIQLPITYVFKTPAIELIYETDRSNIHTCDLCLAAYMDIPGGAKKIRCPDPLLEEFATNSTQP